MPAVVVKWSGTLYNVELSEDATVGALRDALAGLTNVPPAAQKLAGCLALTKAADDVQLFSLSGVRPGQKLMMIGTATSPPSTTRTVEAPAPPQPPVPVHAARHLTGQSPMLKPKLDNAVKTNVLCLDHLVVRTLSKDVFTSAPNIRVLDLSHNVLTDVCPGIAELAELKSVNLSHNQLTAVEPLTALSCLEVLDCSHNLISELQDVRLGPKLRELHLAANHLTALPEGLFEDCSASLRVITLSGNHLNRLPRSLFRLSGLQELDLDRNRLEEFGDGQTVVGLGQLKSLSLQHNQLRVLPDELFANTDLLELNLTGNPVNWDHVEHLPSYEKWVARFEDALKKKYCLR